MIEPLVVLATKKPVTVSAVRFDGVAATGRAILRWMHSAKSGHFREAVGEIGGTLFVPTAQGVQRADAGDWVIKSVDGEYYICPGDVFTQTYDTEIVF